MKYSLEQLKIGDLVFFENKHLNNHDLYWKIVSKNNNGTITVTVNEMGANDTLSIDLCDIKHHTPRIAD